MTPMNLTALLKLGVVTGVVAIVEKLDANVNTAAGARPQQ